MLHCCVTELPVCWKQSNLIYVDLNAIRWIHILRLQWEQSCIISLPNFLSNMPISALCKICQNLQWKIFQYTFLQQYSMRSQDFLFPVKSSSTLFSNIIQWDFKIYSSLCKIHHPAWLQVNMYCMCKLYLSLLYHIAVFAMVIKAMKIMVTIVMSLPIGQPVKQKMARGKGSLSTEVSNAKYIAVHILPCWIH